jgi:S1-C subfamily serine protease
MSMDFTKLINEIKSGVVHLLFMDSSGTKKIASGSGFLINNKLVTCDHVITQIFPLGTMLHIRFENSSKTDFSKDIILNTDEVKSRIETSSSELNNDYCVLNITEIDYKSRYNFELGDPKKDADVGIEILFMGYPFDHLNLVSHRGYVSSVYERNDIYTLQLDASINVSNSGGPLIHPHTKLSLIHI